MRFTLRGTIRCGSARNQIAAPRRVARSTYVAGWCAILVGAGLARAAEPGDQPASPPPIPAGPVSWLEKINLSGVLNVEGRWREHGDERAGNARAMSDLYIRQFSLGVEARLLQGAAATAVLNSEWLDDDLNQGDGRIAIDELHFDIEGRPRLVVGRRTQPFGQFESDLVTDPLTQEAYETKQTGITMAIDGPGGGDLSLTAYKGSVQMDHLFQAAVFDTVMIHRQPLTVRNVDSYIGSAQWSPWADDLTIFGAWLSEPGRDARNTSADAGFTLVPPRFTGLTLNVEYVRALNREIYTGQERQRRESALSAAVSYAFVMRERHLFGRRNYRDRRSSRGAHPVVATVRYESFDDDGLAAAAGAWSLKSRSSLGARYAFRNDGSLLAFVQVELRRSSRRGPETGPARDTEFYVRVGMDY